MEKEKKQPARPQPRLILQKATFPSAKSRCRTYFALNSQIPMFSTCTCACVHKLCLSSERIKTLLKVKPEKEPLRALTAPLLLKRKSTHRMKSNFSSRGFCVAQFFNVFASAGVSLSPSFSPTRAAVATEAPKKGKATKSEV